MSFRRIPFLTWTKRLLYPPSTFYTWTVPLVNRTLSSKNHTSLLPHNFYARSHVVQVGLKPLLPLCSRKCLEVPILLLTPLPRTGVRHVPPRPVDFFAYRGFKITLVYPGLLSCVPSCSSQHILERNRASAAPCAPRLPKESHELQQLGWKCLYSLPAHSPY